MRSAAELIQTDYLVGQLPRTIGRYNAILEAGRKTAGENAPEVMDLRLSLARGYYLLGSWGFASGMFRRLLADIGTIAGDRPELAGRAEFYYGQLLTDLAEPTEAERHLRLALSHLTVSLGERHVLVIDAHTAMGRTLSDLGRFAPANAELNEAHELALKWAPVPSWTETRPRFFMALMLLRQNQPAKAAPLLAEIVNYQDANEAAYLAAQKDLTPELDHTGPVRQALGEALAKQGKAPEAVETLQRAVEVSERASGAQHPQVLATKLLLAEALVAEHRSEDARQLVGSIDASALSALPAAHPILAQWHRVNGLLRRNP